MSTKLAFTKAIMAIFPLGLCLSTITEAEAKPNVDMRCFNGLVNHCNRWYAEEGFVNVAACFNYSVDTCYYVDSPPEITCNDLGVECRLVW